MGRIRRGEGSAHRAEPAKFFTTPHYDGYAVVLGRLDAIDATEADELITESWRQRADASLVRSFDRPANR